MYRTSRRGVHDCTNWAQLRATLREVHCPSKKSPRESEGPELMAAYSPRLSLYKISGDRGVWQVVSARLASLRGGPASGDLGRDGTRIAANAAARIAVRLVRRADIARGGRAFPESEQVVGTEAQIDRSQPLARQ